MPFDNVNDLSCCGTQVRDVPFEAFMRQVRTLYPDFQGKLCVDGVYDSLMASIAHAFYDLYICDCGLADIERELVPHLACCTFDRWVAEYGLADDNCFEQVCFLTDDQVALSRRAQLQARWNLEWGGTFNQTLISSIADSLGIVYEVINPTIRETSDGACVPIYGIGGAQVPYVDPTTVTTTTTLNPDGSTTICEVTSKGDCCVQVTMGRSGQCRDLKHVAAIKITQAPPSINATACSPVAQPLCYNVYVEAFKCLIDSLRPYHLELCFIDDYANNDFTTPPSFDNVCPNAIGLYLSKPLVGEGTLDDPIRLDFDAMSEAQVTAIVGRLKLV